MKLGEALSLRADLQRQLNAMTDDIVNMLKYSHYNALTIDVVVQNRIDEIDRVNMRMRNLVAAINHTNAVATIEPGGATITDSLATRDMLRAEVRMLQRIADACASHPESQRYRETREKLSDTSRLLRDVDNDIQAANWMVDVVFE